MIGSSQPQRVYKNSKLFLKIEKPIFLETEKYPESNSTLTPFSLLPSLDKKRKEIDSKRISSRTFWREKKERKTRSPWRSFQNHSKAILRTSRTYNRLRVAQAITLHNNDDDENTLN
jgi:hypothetical protein